MPAPDQAAGPCELTDLVDPDDVGGAGAVENMLSPNSCGHTPRSRGRRVTFSVDIQGGEPRQVQSYFPWWKPEETVTEALQTVQAWWAAETVVEGTLQENIEDPDHQPSEAPGTTAIQPRRSDHEAFKNGLLGAAMVSPGTIVLCILLL